MGAKTVEQMRNNKTRFVSVDQNTGYLTIDGSIYGAIEGKLLGFNCHTFDYKGAPQKKFDIFVSDDAQYQIQVGFYSWVNFRLINQLINIPALKEGGLIEISTNMKDNNINVFVKWNGTNLKYKYKFADLKFNGKEGDEKTKHRDKIIDKWFAYLMELKPYDPAAQKTDDTDDVAVGEKDDDLPF